MRKFEPPPPSPAARLAELQAAEIQVKPWGGAVEAQPLKAEPPPPLEIEPPPWAGAVELDEAELAAEAEPLERPKPPSPPWAEGELEGEKP